MPKMSTEELVKRIRKIKPWEISTGDFDEFTLDQSDAIALLDRERPTPEPAEDAREVVIKAASIANDYIQGLGDQSRNSEILGRGVQKAILESVELDLQARAYRARLLGEAAERAAYAIVQYLGRCWFKPSRYEARQIIEAAVRGKE